MSAPPHPPLATVLPAELPAVWAPCGHCWGQGRILEPVDGGASLVITACPACLGVGQTVALVDPAAGPRPPARRRAPRS